MKVGCAAGGLFRSCRDLSICRCRPHQLGENRDLTETTNPIPKVLLGIHAQFSACLFQTHERVPTPPPLITPSAAADLSQSCVFPNVVFRQIVVKR